jgi:hypothetical protein
VDIGYWFIGKSSHPGYENAIPPEECPMPCIIEDPVNTNNTDEDEDGIEPTFEGQRFSGTNTKIDPVLRLYPHAPFMCNSTKDVKKGRGAMVLFVVSFQSSSKMELSWTGKIGMVEKSMLFLPMLWSGSGSSTGLSHQGT